MVSGKRCTLYWGLVRGREVEAEQRPEQGRFEPCGDLRARWWLLFAFWKGSCECCRRTAVMAGHHQSEAVSLPLSEQAPGKPSAKASLSCLPYMDGIWSCYSPVYQMRKYYRDGDLDGCGGRWTDLMKCISLKTRPSAEVEAILEKRAATKEKEHIWTYRTEEDASEHWKQEFGHLGK